MGWPLNVIMMRAKNGLIFLKNWIRKNSKFIMDLLRIKLKCSLGSAELQTFLKILWCQTYQTPKYLWRYVDTFHLNLFLYTAFNSCVFVILCFDTSCQTKYSNKYVWWLVCYAVICYGLGICWKRLSNLKR